MDETSNTDVATLDDLSSWVFLTDPSWEGEKGAPPPAAVVGGWPVAPDGVTGPFRPNPAYEPSVEGLPTDPVDTCLRLINQGVADGDDLLRALNTTELAIAVDDEKTAVIVPAPDGEPCVMVATAPTHRWRVHTVSWVALTVEDLADILPDEGVDVLINPGGSDSVRLLSAALKSFTVEDAPGHDTAPAEAVDIETLWDMLVDQGIDEQIVDMIASTARDAVTDTLAADGQQAADRLSSILPPAFEVLDRNEVVNGYLRRADDRTAAATSLGNALLAVANAWIDEGGAAADMLAGEFLSMISKGDTKEHRGA